MADVVRWGILGASSFAKQRMAPAIHTANGAKLVALATSSADKAAGFTAFCPDLKIHSSYDDLLADPNVDAVYIPLPNGLHVEWTKKAIAAGKHVLCEKPIALEAPEIDELIAARDAANLHVAEAFMITHHPQWHLVRDLLAKGTIGKLSHVSVQFCFNNAADVNNTRHDPNLGGGALRDIGVYTMGSVLFATGVDPEAITHVDMRQEYGVDVFTNVQAQFPGFSYSGLVSMRISNVQEVRFMGDAGHIVVTTPFNAGNFAEAQVHVEAGLETSVTRFPDVDQYVLQVEAFGDTVLNGAEYVCPLELSRRTQAMMDRVFAIAGQD